ncbi:hypothetical protein SAMN05660900_01034 [Megasphaera cerevisiae DSM 20462]|nr:hypothetical protein SAMN05660900_01034 [Megasphaera cerevisiae DSM 20462]
MDKDENRSYYYKQDVLKREICNGGIVTHG